MFTNTQREYIGRTEYLSKLVEDANELEPKQLSHGLEILDKLLCESNQKAIEGFLDPFLEFLKCWELDRNRALRWIGITLRLYRIATPTSAKKNDSKITPNLFESVTKGEVLQLFSKTNVDAEVFMLCLCLCWYSLDSEQFKKANAKRKSEVLNAVLRHIKGIEFGI